MPLLNAFVDSFVCVGFSSKVGLTLDPASKTDGSLFTSNLQSSVLAIITSDCATYPSAQSDEALDSSYPPLNRMSSRNSLVLSMNSDRSTPISSLTTSAIRTPKQHILLVGYADLPHYCFPDGIQITYERAKEKIHHFVLTQDGKRSYALALTFQQAFALKTNQLDDDGIYQISDVQSSTQNARRSGASKIPVAIDKTKIVSPSTTASSSPEREKRSRKMPSAYPGNSPNRTRSTSSHDTDKQSPQQPSRHYEVQTVSSYKKNLSSKAIPPPSRLPRTKSQDNVSLANKTSTTTTSRPSGMRNRTGSTTTNPLPINPISTSTSSSSTSSSSSSSSTTTSTPSEPIKPFYLPHCIVLISTEPYWTAMQETISIIHDEITRSNIEPCSKEYKKLIQKYAFLVTNTPIPPVPWERYSLSFNVTNDRFVITFDPPINANRSVLDLDLSIVLITLNIGKLLDVLAAIFTERPIIFFSSNYSTLVTTLECLLYLIYPLKWNNIYIPLVPDGLRNVYLEGSPGLYIKGAHPRHQKIIEDLNVCLTCNLDNDKNVYVPNNIEFYNLPPTKTQNFIDPITQLFEEITKARALRNVPTAARLPMEEQREVDRQNRFETNQKISKIFLSLMIDLCGDALEPNYWRVNTQQANPTKLLNDERRYSNLAQTTGTVVPMFLKEKYLRPKIEGIDLEFYRSFVETVAFQYLLKEEMMSTSPSGFKQICQMRDYTKEHNLYLFNNTQSDDNYNNQFVSTPSLDDPLSSQMLLKLPEWPLDLSSHYLDSCIEIFTDELEEAQEERSPAALAVYSYLRGCARLARGEYLDGLRDLYSIENPKLFPQQYIETVIAPRLAEERLLDIFLNERFYTNCPEWKKIRTRSISQSMSSIDLDDSGKLAVTTIIPPSPDTDLGWDIVEDTITYRKFSDHVHRLNIVIDKDTTEALFKALSYWTNNQTTKTLKKDSTLTSGSNKTLERNKTGSAAKSFTFQHTTDVPTYNPRKTQATTPIQTPTPKLPPEPDLFLPTTLFETFVDIWYQTKAEKSRMGYHLPEDRQKHESILKISSSGIVSKKDGPGQIILTQKRLYFLPEAHADVRLLTELINIVSVDKYQHQTAFFSSQPGIKIHTLSTSSTSSLPRDNNRSVKSKAMSLERESKSSSSSISLFFKTNHEQELWYIIIVEIWSGLKIAHEQCDTAVLNEASRHIALMDTLANIDYNDETTLGSDKLSTNSRQRSRQRHNEECLEMALKELSLFTRMHKSGTLKSLPRRTREVLIRRLSPSINEIERHAVRCLVFTEHPETGQSSLWCAYGSKLKVFNITTSMCDPNDLCFPSIITSMCLDARHKLWIRCIEGQLFVVDTLTRVCEGELDTNDGENGCQTIVFDSTHNHILTANQAGVITVWNALSWEQLYKMNLLEMYQKAHSIQDKTYVSQAKVTLQTNKEPPKVGKTSNRKPSFSSNAKEAMNLIDISDLPSFNIPAQTNPSPNDKLERIQIYEDLLFACYRDDYIIVLRISDSNIYTYEHLISIKYKTGNALPIDTFLVYNNQLWVATGCIISIFSIDDTSNENAYNLKMRTPVDDESAYNLIMKKPVDDDNLVTMLGFSKFVWAGSLNGNIYIYRMDNYELYKTLAGHRDSVYCLCPMLDMHVVSGSAERDTSIIIWENVRASNVQSATTNLASNMNII